MASTSTPESIDPDSWTCVDAVRKRPAMYVGSTGFFGFINFLVCPFALLLARNPRRIDVSVTDAGFEIDSDATLDIHQAGDGRIIPFEVIESAVEGHSFEGCVLNSLSRTLVVRAAHSGSLHTLTYERGRRTSCAIREDDGSFTHLSFAPDDSIFTVTELSPVILESYLRRLSYLHRGVRFRLSHADQEREYFAAGGIRDLFECVSAPYQLLHAPIPITASEGRLRLELVFAYQSWSENAIWCYINNGRAVEGGTHEKGLRRAFDQLYKELKLPRRPKHARNGVVALMSIIYPDVVWEGCIKARIGSPELLEMVPRLVVSNVMNWVAGRPEVAHQLTQVEPFQFPDAWYS